MHDQHKVVFAKDFALLVSISKDKHTMQKLTIAILVLFCLSAVIAKKHALVGHWVGPIEE